MNNFRLNKNESVHRSCSARLAKHLCYALSFQAMRKDFLRASM